MFIDLSSREKLEEIFITMTPAILAGSEEGDIILDPFMNRGLNIFIFFFMNTNK